MKIFKPLEKLIAMHTVLFGLIVLGLLPEEQPYNDTSTLGWALYFAIIAIALVFTIRSWIDYADYKRQQFRWQSFTDEVRILTEEEYEREFGRLLLGEHDNSALEVWEEQAKWKPEDVYDWTGEEDPFRDDNEPNQGENNK